MGWVGQLSNDERAVGRWRHGYRHPPSYHLAAGPFLGRLLHACTQDRVVVAEGALIPLRLA